MGESLLSLEIFVHEVKDLSVPCVIPGVAFRLLDYPTLIIYYLKLDAIEKLRKKFGSYSTQPDAMYDLSKLRNTSQGFTFERGKSCLFKKPLEELESLLKKVPLYVMLTECWSEKPKLIGSCFIPLSALFGKIVSCIAKEGTDCPAVNSETSTYKFFNLMGTMVGRVRLRCKLTYFGGSLMRHVTVDKVVMPELDVFLNTRQEKVPHQKLNIGDAHVEDSVDLHVYPADGENKSLDGMNNVLVDAPKEKKQVLKSALSQTDSIVDGHILPASHSSSDEETENCNIVCPPPLYINARPGSLSSLTNRTSSTGYQREKFESLKKKKLLAYDFEERTFDDVPVSEILKPVHDRKEVYEVVTSGNAASTQTEERSSGLIAMKKSTPLEQLANLPVLFALLQDIAKLTTSGSNGAASHPLVDIVTTDSATQVEKGRLNESAHYVSHLRMDGEVLSAPLLTKRSLKKQPLPRQARQKILSAKPVKKQGRLQYGLTKSHNLRYQLSHQDRRDRSMVSNVAYEKKTGKKLLVSPVRQSVATQASMGIDEQDLRHVGVSQETQTDVDDVRKVFSGSVHDRNSEASRRSKKKTVRKGSRTSLSSDVAVAHQTDRVSKEEAESFTGLSSADLWLREQAAIAETGSWLPIRNVVEQAAASDRGPDDEYYDDSFHSFHSNGSRSTISATSSVTLSNDGLIEADSRPQTAMSLQRQSGSALSGRRSSRMTKPRSSRSHSGLQSRVGSSQLDRAFSSAMSRSSRSRRQESRSEGNVSEPSAKDEPPHSEPLYRLSSAESRKSSRMSDKIAPVTSRSVNLGDDKSGTARGEIEQQFYDSLDQREPSQASSYGRSPSPTTDYASVLTAINTGPTPTNADPNVPIEEKETELVRSPSRSFASERSVRIGSQTSVRNDDLSSDRPILSPADREEEQSRPGSSHLSKRTSDVSSYGPDSAVSNFADQVEGLSDVSSYRPSTGMSPRAYQIDNLSDVSSYRPTPSPPVSNVVAGDGRELSEKLGIGTRLPTQSTKSPVPSKKFSSEKRTLTNMDVSRSARSAQSSNSDRNSLKSSTPSTLNSGLSLEEHKYEEEDDSSSFDIEDILRERTTMGLSTSSGF